MSAVLGGTWRFTPDLRDAGQKHGFHMPRLDDSGWMAVPVSTAWDTYAFELRGYEGTGWFRRRFRVAGKRPATARFTFDGAGHECRVWLNGRELGHHEGSYVPFTLEAADAIRSGENTLAVRVNNVFSPRTIPPSNTDWHKYGGITRDVRLVTSDSPIFSRLTATTGGNREFPVATVRGEVWTPPGAKAGSAVVSTGVSISPHGPFSRGPFAREILLRRGESTSFEISFPARGLPLWSPKIPNLVFLKAELTRPDGAVLDRESKRFGIRTISVSGDGIRINGERTWLRGTNQVEEYPDWTPTVSKAAVRRRILDMKRNLNCNFFRAAHYPHNPILAEVCDEVGFTLLEEIPMCYYPAFPGTLEKGAEMSRELFWRDAHHPSVVIWSMGNERPSERKDVAENISSLILNMKRLDSSRPVTCVSNRALEDKSFDVHDVLCVNEYWGVWGEPAPFTASGIKAAARRLSKTLDTLNRRYPGKPVVITEFGAPTFPGEKGIFGGDKWQAELIRAHTSVFKLKPIVAGCAAWCYTDQRLSSYQHYPPGYLGTTSLEVFGLTRLDGSRRPAWRTLSEFYKRISRRGK